MLDLTFYPAGAFGAADPLRQKAELRVDKANDDDRTANGILRELAGILPELAAHAMEGFKGGRIDLDHLVVEVPWGR